MRPHLIKHASICIFNENQKSSLWVVLEFKYLLHSKESERTVCWKIVALLFNQENTMDCYKKKISKVVFVFSV